jgi:selenocysteine lyase/cysteine desulfurase
VNEFLPWYSSVYRGSGFKSRVSTEAFEAARDAVARFVEAGDEHLVVFVGNTTEAINVLSAALPEGTRVLGSPAEHHANLLPWREHSLELLPFTSSPGELLDACGRMLQAGGGGIGLVAVTGASNVTGEIPPLAEIASLAHSHGAELFVDAAQLAPHRRISMADLGIDYLALSGHKLYAPFGAGALVGRREALRHGRPLIRGGGAVSLVTLDDVVWAEPPARFEAGSPNVVGAVALGAACDELGSVMRQVEARERALAERLCDGLEEITGLRLLRLWPRNSCDCLGVASFALDAYPDTLVSAALAAEHGIGVRHGRFCAQPLTRHLLGVSDVDARSARRTPQVRKPRPGAVRASLGLGTVAADIETLVGAVGAIAAEGPRWRYRYDERRNEHVPDPDPRVWPDVGRMLKGRREAQGQLVDRAEGFL